ncbi:Ferredoxin-dependent glutamate synthase 2 [Caprobacter fermentans]|uniref:Ferredoxin-dependent glutamate synthase 2 n=1 Tax=Caproicibacter fermentans TaxID=2576756 RepID=A0A6N8HVB5_9FIRM|nr:glutamate synthase [Caproicibacter fermentans]MVB09608.1 Ferredoxin-dependent glutamate synthase 2 [Caproicibacter fermentans]
MNRIDANGRDFRALNEEIRAAGQEILIENCMGQRYIAAGMSGVSLTIQGIPGNALGCYLNGGTIRVHGNAQDQTGDTMNSGTIVVDGSCGDATGYSMRGGKILVRGNAGYRVGIHMKAYREQQPLIVVGGETGSFLGEYQAGGTIIVLGIGSEKKAPVGNLCGTGMHGGKMFLRAEELPADLPPQVAASKATEEDMAEIDGYLEEFCAAFSMEKQSLFDRPFYVLRPNSANPYQNLYTFN